MVASLASGYDVFPCVLAALASRDDVIKGHVGASSTAVLARVAVAQENLSAREFAAVKGFADHVDETDNLGAFEHPGNGVDVFDTALNRFGFSFAK